MPISSRSSLAHLAVCLLLATLTSAFILRPPPSHYATTLFAKKKAPPASNKIQVKLLQHVAGTGQAGQVVMVAPAFYQNKLRPGRLASLISDSEVAEEKALAQEQAADFKRRALALQDALKSTTLTFKRKAGPNGHLFGGIHYKQLAEEIQQRVDEGDLMHDKTIKFTGIVDEEGKEVQGADIKHLGKYVATLALSSEIKAKVTIVVESEE
jgi:ribosomal protein L9